MFDFGWQEFILIAFVLVLVVGPKELPKILRNFTKFISQIKNMAREFTSSLESAVDEDEIKSVKNIVSDVKTGKFDQISNVVDENFKSEIKNLDNIGINEIKEDLKSVHKTNKIPNDKSFSKTNDKKKKV